MPSILNNKLQTPTQSEAPAAKRGDVRSAKGRRILDAAMSVFVKEGFAAFGLRRVAQIAKLSLGTLQYYYPTSEALLEATITGLMHGFNDELTEIVDSSVAAEERLEASIRCILRQVLAPDTPKLIFEIMAVAQRDATTRSTMFDAYKVYRQLMTRLVGALRPDLSDADRYVRATAFCAQMEGLLFFAAIDGAAAPTWPAIEATARAGVKAMINS